MHDIFISYAHEDRAYAHRLAELLGQAGLDVWWDPELRAGQKFARVIEQTLQQVHGVVVLWSRASLQSDWVDAEASEGLRLNKLIPVVLDDSTPPLIYRGLHTLWLGEADLYAGSDKLQRLVDDIRAQITAAGGAAPGATAAANHRPVVPRAWRVAAGLTLLAVLAAGSGGWAARLVDLSSGWLATSALAIPPLFGEVLVALLAALGGAIAALRYRRRRIWLWLGCALSFAAGVHGYAWVERTLRDTQDHLYGRVLSDDWTDMQVVALDAVGREVSLQPMRVQTDGGTFGMRLKPVFADRPYWLRVQRPGCRARQVRIPWRVWRERQDFDVEFRCD